MLAGAMSSSRIRVAVPARGPQAAPRGVAAVTPPALVCSYKPRDEYSGKYAGGWAEPVEKTSALSLRVLHLRRFLATKRHALDLSGHLLLESAVRRTS